MADQDILSQFLAEELRLIIASNAAGLIEMLLYGIHLVLFCICMYILARNKHSTQRFILISAIVMFILSTVDVSLTILVLTHDLANVFDASNILVVEKHVFVKIPIFVTNNLIADLILLYRCYMVWGKSKYILIGASLLVFADSLWGYLGTGGAKSLLPQDVLLPLYVWSIFGINMILTAITVGRIFWVSRMAMALTGSQQFKVYRTTMAILVESSLVYSACIFVYLLYPSGSPYRIIMVTICMRVVAIMPTLLIVQVGLGRAIQENNNATTISELEFGGRTHSIVLDSLMTSMQTGDGTTSAVLRSRLDDEESQECTHEQKK